MPAVKMRSSGAPPSSTRFSHCVNSSCTLRPDQNSRSNTSLSPRTRRRPKSLAKITVQLARDTSSSTAMTHCTTRLAWVTR